LAVGLLSSRAAEAPARGDLWQATSQMTMSMQGTTMPTPPRTLKLCAAKVWTKPPVADNPQMKCKNTNYAINGPKVTWTSVCTGEMTMTGVGEITRQGSDAYSGTVQYKSTEATMTVTISGQKVGECDNPS
jgi:uncharacterized protein DUF3617